MYICSLSDKRSPCRATPHPFKCVGLHVLGSVNTYVERCRKYTLQRTKRKERRKKSMTKLFLKAH